MAQATDYSGVTARARILGSGFTIWGYAGQPIAFGQTISHTSPTLVGGGFQAIQPIDEPYATQILTSMAANPGQVVINLYELWGQGSSYKIWDNLGAKLGNTNQITTTSGSTTTFGSGASNGAASGGIFQGAADIVDLAIIQAQQDPSTLYLTEFIKPLPGVGGSTVSSTTPYAMRYHGATITAANDGEQVTVGSLQVIKQITFNYTYATRLDSSTSNQALALR